MIWHEHCSQCWKTLDKSTGVCYRGGMMDLPGFVKNVINHYVVSEFKF